MARRRKSPKRNFAIPRVDSDMRPVLISSLLFGFAISYSRFYNATSISAGLYSFALATLVSYLLLIFVYRVFSKFLFYKNAEMTKNHNPTNYFFIIVLTILTNGSVLFLDMMNFDLKFKRSYRPFLKEGWRSGLGYETAYRSALLVFLILLSSIVYLLHNSFDSIVTYYLLSILSWTLIWSAIPTSAIFSAFLMLGGAAWKNARLMVPETGGTKMLFANRRMWIFFGTLSLFWGIGLRMNLHILDVFMSSLVGAIFMLVLLLLVWDFRVSTSRVFAGKKDVTK
ncbi:MAG: hypothetical protein QF460_02580 [Candidatus Nanoarchaeia archaeon]|jgi:hypothetical protein|nr:hypothetical protein [Candidatus Nanoarchaeia archaeon]|tara:strand:+ start:896 stop:1744 length:849 start_codon:yes stop_codon:yes gene_type:complete